MTSKTTRIQCTCPICTVNAKRLGKVVLAAEITDQSITSLGGQLSRQAIHGVVHAANHPQIGRALRAHHTSYWAVA